MGGLAGRLGGALLVGVAGGCGLWGTGGLEGRWGTAGLSLTELGVSVATCLWGVGLWAGLGMGDREEWERGLGTGFCSEDGEICKVVEHRAKPDTINYCLR